MFSTGERAAGRGDPREGLMAVGRKVNETERVCAFIDLTFRVGTGK